VKGFCLNVRRLAISLLRRLAKLIRAMNKTGRVTGGSLSAQPVYLDLLEIVMRRYERASTLLTSNRPVEDWGKLLRDTAAISAMLDRLLHHGHVLKCGPRSWRAKAATE
jgi:hypothetical protein